MTLTNAPTLETERLILRGPQVEDFAAVADFHSTEHCVGFSDPLSRPDAWRWFALNVGHWHIHGYGYFSVVEKSSGKQVGLSGIWNPEGWPEPELGYAIFQDFEGKGVAYEASVRTRAWAYESLGFATLSSHIVPSNTRSIALAKRLGGSFERSYDNPHMGEDHIYRYPSPQAVA